MKKFLSVLLAVMMVLSTVSFAAPSVAGTYETAVEVPAVEETAVEEATLAAMSTDVATYGQLLWFIDFEDSTYPAVQNGEISECGPINNYISAENERPLPAEFTGFYRIQAPKDAAYNKEWNRMNGTNVFTVGCAATQYPYFGISSYTSETDWNSYAMPAGHYTFVGDFAKGESNSGKSLCSRIPTMVVEQLTRLKLLQMNSRHIHTI